MKLLKLAVLLAGLLLSCTLGQIACARHGPTAAVEQKESVTDTSSEPGEISRQVATENLSIPVQRILSVENYLTHQNDELQEQQGRTKGAPQSPYQSVNYIQSHKIGEKRGADGNCGVYTLNPCQAEGSCQQANGRGGEPQLRHVEVWLRTTCVRSLMSGSHLSSANISITAFHHFPHAGQASTRSRHIGVTSVDMSPRGAAAQPWLLVSLHSAVHFVNFAFKRSRPIYLQICHQWSQGDVSNQSETPMPPPDPRAFFLTFYQRQALSIVDFIETADVRASITRADGVVRGRRSAESTEMSGDMPAVSADISSTGVSTGVRTSQEASTASTETTAPSTNRTSYLPIDHNLLSNNPSEPRDLCRVTEFTLDFSSIDSRKTYYPATMNMTACVGACTRAVKPATNFAALQRLMRSGSNPDPSLRQTECCIPKSFRSNDRHRNVVIQDGTMMSLVSLQDVWVASCGCT